MTNWQYPLVVVNFPKFAGGKFLINCLSLSQHSVPQHAESALQILANPLNLALRQKAIASTLPTKDDMHNWHQYELGCQQLFGSEVEYWRRGIRLESSSDIVAPLTCSKLSAFLVSHNIDEVKKLQKVWPNLIVIRLYNYETFQSISSNLKGGADTFAQYNGNECEEKYNELAGPDWPPWKMFSSCSYNTSCLHPRYARYVREINEFYPYSSLAAPCFEFDVSTYFDQTRFIDEVKKLYQWLNFTDFDQKLIKELWQSYIALHVDIDNKTL